MMGSPKRAVYRIPDCMVAFCQNIVRKSRSIPIPDPYRMFDVLESDIRTFLGLRFEDFCARYVADTRDCLEIGKWWGIDTEKEVHEIDIAATVLENGVKVSLFGECKFKKAPVGAGVLRDLRNDAELTRDPLSRRYILFSVSGFASEVEDADDVELVGLKGLSARLHPDE